MYHITMDIIMDIIIIIIDIIQIVVHQKIIDLIVAITYFQNFGNCNCYTPNIDCCNKKYTSYNTYNPYNFYNNFIIMVLDHIDIFKNK